MPFLDPKIEAPRRHNVVTPSTGQRLCYSEWCKEPEFAGISTFLGKEVPFSSRNASGSTHGIMLPWPAFDGSFNPRSPRGPTSGTPASPYRECWGRVGKRSEPASILTWSATGDPPVPDYTICRNEVANQVGADCFGTLDFGVGGGFGYPAGIIYQPTDNFETRKRPLCGLRCACCPCESMCFAMTGFSAPLFVGVDAEGPMAFPGIPRLICTDGPPILFGDGLSDGYGWVFTFGDICSSSYATSGTLLSGETYRLALSSVIVYAPNVFYEDCYITVLFTWTGVYTTPGGVCENCDCIDGVLNPLCTDPNCSFGVTGALSFGINTCPDPDDPNPQVADLTTDLILQHNRVPTYVFGSPTSGEAAVCCAPCPSIDPDIDWPPP